MTYTIMPGQQLFIYEITYIPSKVKFSYLNSDNIFKISNILFFKSFASYEKHFKYQ